MPRLSVVAVTCVLAASCARGRSADPTAADAKTFLDNANQTTLKLGVEASQAGWVQQTFITDDTEAIAARANQRANEAGARFAKEATKFDRLEVSEDQRRQLNLLKVSLVLAA